MSNTRDRLLRILINHVCDSTDCSSCQYYTQEDCYKHMLTDILIQKGVVFSDDTHEANRDFEIKYAKIMDNLEKIKHENACLREELQQKRNEMAYYKGIKQAVEVIFGKEFTN